LKRRQCFTRTKRLLLLVCAAIALSNSAIGQESIAAVSVEDIGTRVTLVGRLGQPLGKMMEVRGTWKYPSRDVKDYSLRFHATHVNGKTLETPVEFNISQIKAVSQRGVDAIPRGEKRKALDGDIWTMRAYETGRHNAVPADYWKESGQGMPGLPYWHKTFTSELVGIAQER
jgi:hypothetical protein